MSDADLAFPSFKRIYRLMLPQRWLILGGTLCMVVTVIAELYPPLVWLHVVDVGIPNRDIPYIVRELILFLIIMAIGQVFSAWRSLLLEKASQELTLDLRLQLYQKLQGQSAEYFSAQRTGDLISRVSADVEAIQDLLVRGTDSVLANALRLIGVAAILIALQPVLGVIVVLPMILVGVLLARYNDQVRPFYRASRKRLGEFSARLADNLIGVRLIQAFARERHEFGVLRTLGNALLVEQVEAVKLRNQTFPIIRFVANLGQFLMLAGGTFFILIGQFTLGGLLAYRGYGRYFFGPVDELVNVDDLLQRASASGLRIFAVLDAPVSLADAPNAIPLPQPLRGEVAFENVTFGYDADRPVLHNLNLRLHPGERVVVLGPSGAGKSTLLSLVTRMYDPLCGHVCLDGHDIRGVTLESLRSSIAQVQQETFLFNASVLENVRFGHVDSTPAEVEAACRAANAHEFIAGLPQGYDTVVGERGVKLSGGQKQRIAVARALLANPAMLVLDEPTSAVEPESEASIIDALERLMQGRTTLIVTHRLSLARTADRVVIVEQGRLVEDGAPRELMGKPNSRFAAMMQQELALA